MQEGRELQTLMMKALIIYNLKAGRGRSQAFAEAAVALFAEQNIYLKPKALTLGENPFDGDEDAELVVICGGDGSINYVVNCMRQKDLNPTLGIVPMGTANDMANALDLPRSPKRALKRILEGEVHDIDCGKVNDRYFVNVLSFGMGTTASQHTPRDAKKHLGKLAYIKPGFDELRKMSPVRVNIKTESEEFTGNILIFLAFNGVTAGRMHLARNSRIDDGLFDVAILEARNTVLSYGDMVRYLLGGNPETVHHFRCSHMEVTTEQYRATDVDGEPGPNFPLTITCEHGGLKIKY